MTNPDKQIAALLLRYHGMDVSKYAHSFLNKSLQRRMTKTSYDSIEEYYDFLEDNEEERAAFIDSLQINYSEFFRNQFTFTLMKQTVLPAILLKKKPARNKEIRVWSAACAGGEEAYSLAILLEELGNSCRNEVPYRLFATDQSPTQINRAMQGQFAPAALKNLSLKRAEDWFTREGEVYKVKPKLKEHIDFSTFDLFDPTLSCPPASIFGDFDLVVCANLLFYYQPEYQCRILEKAGNSLASGGYLVTGESERTIVLNCKRFQELLPQSAIFQMR